MNAFSRVLPVPLLLFAMLLSVRDAGASVVQLGVEDLVARSECVIHGEVLETHSAYGEWIHGGEIIYTIATVRVLDVLAGEAPGIVEVTLPGGTVGGRTLRASDCPTLSPGEDVVLFLLPYQGKRWITGLDNGKYVVLGETAVNTGHQTARELPLEALRREIREAAASLGSDIREGGGR